MAEQHHNVFRILKRWWMAFANAVGWFNTRLLLTIFYFVLLAIPAVLLKILGKDLLNRKFRNRESYWIPKEPMQHTTEEAKRQF